MLPKEPMLSDVGTMLAAEDTSSLLLRPIDNMRRPVVLLARLAVLRP